MVVAQRRRIFRGVGQHAGQVVLPLDDAVRARARVQQNAAERGVAGPAEAERLRVVEHVVDRRELEPRIERCERRGTARADAGHDVDEHEIGDEIGPCGRRVRCGEAAERLADQRHGRVGPLLDRADDVGRERLGGVVGVVAPRGIAVPRKIDGDRGGVQIDHGAIPGVGVEARAVQEDGARGTGTEPDRAERPAVRQRQLHALCVGDRGALISGVIGEEGELVQVGVRRHRRFLEEGDDRGVSNSAIVAGKNPPDEICRNSAPSRAS